MSSLFPAAPVKAGILALASAVTAATACGSSATDPAPAEGMYSVVWNRRAQSCSPQALPAPIGSDPSEYVQIAAGNVSVQGNLQIKLTDSSITLAPMNINGIPFPNDAFVGVRVGGAGSLIARSAVLTEGPRQNGHQFVVKMYATDTASFFFLREDPPGNGIESVVTITGRVTYEFHDGSLSGTIYTTCIEQDSIAGQKL